MKLLIDAHLPRRLAISLQRAGFDAIHTLDLPQGNRTADGDINQLSIAEQRVVITKDSDFVDSFVLRKEPWKLLLVSTGNIRNAELLELFAANIDKIVQEFAAFDFIEITRTNLITHF